MGACRPLEEDIAGEARAVAMRLASEDDWDWSRDVTESDPAAVRQVLTDTGIGASAPVVLLWAYSSDAVLVEFRSLVEWFDDWWYPSSDDLWVRDLDGGSLVEFDHEEVIRFRRGHT